MTTQLTTYSVPPLLAGTPPTQPGLAVVAVVLAVSSVLLLVPAPGGRLRRLRRLDLGPTAAQSGQHTRSAGGAPPTGVGRITPRVWRLLLGRPDAAPVRARLLLAGVTGGGVLGLLGLAHALAGAARPVAGLVAALASFLVAGRLESSSARERRLRMVVELPHLLDLLTAALGAGLPLRVAVAQVGPLVGGPLDEDLGQVLRQVELGVPEAQAWRTLRGHSALGRLALDLARSVDSGLMLAATLAHHAAAARRTRRAALEARARSVGVHSVPPLMVCFLPAFLLIGVVPTGVSAFLHALG